MSASKAGAAAPKAPTTHAPLPDEARTTFDVVTMSGMAESLRNSPAFAEGLQNVRRKLFSEFRRIPSTDLPALARNRVAWELLDEFEGALGKLVTDGRHEAHQRDLRTTR